MQYIWFVGGSGVGKRTLINKLQEPSNQGLRSRFGIIGSVVAYGPHPQFENAYTLDALKSATADSVLIKWQWSTKANIQRLKETRPDCDHRVYSLWRPYEIRCKHLNESRGRGYMSIPQMENEWTNLMKPFSQLIGEMVSLVELVDSSTPDYSKIYEWP